MRAVILAGGRGSRLAPFTTVVPKPLLPVADTPILEVIVRQLASAGFDHITLALGYMSQYFHAFVAQHRSLRRLARIDFVEEETPTGTAGSLAHVPGLSGTFLVMNGDILTDLDYGKLVSHHRARGGMLTIGLHDKKVTIDLGIVESGRDGRVERYIEKPTLSYAVSMGIYVYDEGVLAHIRSGEYLDFPSLVQRLLAAGHRVVTYPNSARWLDLGRFEDLQRASELFTRYRHEFLPADPPAARAA